MASNCNRCNELSAMHHDCAGQLRVSVNEANNLKTEVANLTAENKAVRTLMDSYNVGGWTDSLKCVADLQTENEQLKAMVVMEFTEERLPVYTQGLKYHELLEPMTAERCTWYVQKIETLTTKLAEAETTAGSWKLSSGNAVKAWETLATANRLLHETVDTQKDTIDALTAALTNLQKEYRLNLEALTPKVPE